MCHLTFFSKYTWVVPLKEKEGITIVNAFQKILDNSMRKPSKIWVEKGNAHHFGSYDTYFPFQQEIPNKNIFYNVFLRQLDFSAKVQN